MGISINDTTLQGSITPAPNIDAFTFNATPNHVISLIVVNTGDQLRGFQPKVEIYDPAGLLIKRVVGQSVRIDTTLTGGTHTIWISDDNGFETGTYGLTLIGSSLPVTWLYLKGQQQRKRCGLSLGYRLGTK